MKPEDPGLAATILGTGTHPHEAHEVLAGRYRLLGLAGSGGMGHVYRALDLQLGDVVALKVLRSDLANREAVIERFRQEARLARRVTHKNVARTFDIGEHGDVPFLTMELVDGASLASWLGSQGVPPEVRALAIARAILDGLSAAHESGVVHRDLKPENVMIAADGRVVVMDFGIARASGPAAAQTGSHGIGTPAYMAPEQLEGRADIDARADVYAFGEIAFELLTGRRAWEGESLAEVAMARLVREPPDPRQTRPVSDALAVVVLRCMAKKREHRFEDARAVRDAWDAATTGSGALLPTISQATLSPATYDGTSVAVLPIRNLGAAEDAFLADGVTEDLIDALSMTDRLRVRPRGVVARFAGRDVDPREAGRELDVEAVVEGSLRRTAQGVRLTARLLGVVDGFQLWAQRFDCAIGELLVASDEAARAVAVALASTIAGPTRKAPTDGTAVELYLRACAAMRRNWYMGATDAIALFRDALDRAPSDAMILSSFAMARSRFARTPTDLHDARALADQAIAVGGHLGAPWVALATIHRHEGEHERQIAALAKALSIAPNQVDALVQLAQLLVDVGPIEVACARLRRALVLDPSDDSARSYASIAELARGDAARAEELIAGPLRPGPASQLFPVQRARIALRDKRPSVSMEGAAASCRPYLELVASVLGGAGVPAGVQAQMEESIRKPTLVAALVAEAYGAVGDVDAALEHVKRAVDAGSFDLVWADGCPFLDAARARPEWAPLRARIAERADRIRNALTREGLLTI